MARGTPWHGEVVSIHIAPKAEDPMKSLKAVRAIPGKGLEGDRYFRASGTYSDRPGPGREITLIESEAIEAMARDNELAIAPGEARRNVVTRGAPLNHLVGREFLVGGVRLRGIRLCEPCSHLEGLTRRSCSASTNALATCSSRPERGWSRSWPRFLGSRSRHRARLSGSSWPRTARASSCESLPASRRHCSNPSSAT